MTQAPETTNRHAVRPAAGGDGGPPPDPDSPFAAETARRTRAAVQRRSLRSRGRTALAWLIALAIVAVAVWGGIQVTGYRLAGASDLPIGAATLTTEAVSVPAPGDGQVVDVLVHPSQRVSRGTPRARMRLFGDDPTGKPITSDATVTSPIAGVVASVAAPDGSAVHRGGSVVELYDPRGQTFEATVDTATVSELREGMRARVSSPALDGPVTAVVDHVVSPLQDAAPGPGETPAAPDTLTLVLRPLHPDDVAGLTPGLRFDVVVETDTGPKGAPSIARVAS